MLSAAGQTTIRQLKQELEVFLHADGIQFQMLPSARSPNAILVKITSSPKSASSVLHYLEEWGQQGERRWLVGEEPKLEDTGLPPMYAHKITGTIFHMLSQALGANHSLMKHVKLINIIMRTKE
jgi:hypothetical protein